MNDKTLHVSEIHKEMYTVRNHWWIMSREWTVDELCGNPLSDNEIVLTDWFEDPYNPSETEIALFKLEFGIEVLR